jgi:hypothetical protein
MILTKEQKNIFCGHMLGDGWICCGEHNRFGLGQKEANKEWVEHAYNALQPFTKGRKLSFCKADKTGKNYEKINYKKDFYLGRRKTPTFRRNVCSVSEGVSVAND